MPMSSHARPALTAALAAAAAAGALLAAAPAALAAAPWSEPVAVAPVPAADYDGLSARLVTDAGGHALVAALLRPSEDPVSGLLAARPASGAPWRLARRLGRRLDELAVAAYGPGAAISVTLATDRRAPELRARIGDVGGGVRVNQALAHGRGIEELRDAALAAGPRGDAAVAWFERRRERPALRVALRPAGRRFRRAVPVAGLGEPAAPLPAGGSPAVGVGPRGDVVIAWLDRRGRIVARVRRAGARRFGALRVAGRAEGDAPRIGAAVAGDGRVLVAWTSRRGGANGTPAPALLQAAVLPASGGFRPPQALERIATGEDPGRVAVAFTVQGLGLAAWTGRQDGASALRLARLGFLGFEAPRTLGMIVDAWALAVGPDAGYGLAWTSGTRVLAVLGDGGDPGPPEVVFDPPDLVAGPQLAFGPRGRATVVFIRDLGERLELDAADRP